MTRSTYDKYHDSPDPYVPKHAKKWYNVWRVLGPAGPEERFPVLGAEEARQAIKGCWDWEVTDTSGNLVPDSLLYKR